MYTHIFLQKSFASTCILVHMAITLSQMQSCTMDSCTKQRFWEAMQVWVIRLLCFKDLRLAQRNRTVSDLFGLGGLSWAVGHPGKLEVQHECIKCMCSWDSTNERVWQCSKIGETWDQPQDRERWIHSQVLKSCPNHVSCLPFPSNTCFTFETSRQLQVTFGMYLLLWQSRSFQVCHSSCLRFPRISTAWSFLKRLAATFLDCISIEFSKQSHLKE